MKQPERRYTHGTNTEVRMGEGEGVAKRIAGLGIVFYREGVEGTDYELDPGIKERIMPEAIDRALAENDDVRGLFNHDSNQLLGRTSAGTMTLRKTDDGIEYDIAPGSTTIHSNVVEHIERCDLTGSSFAFIVTDFEWIEADGDDVRLIRGVELFDIGPVTFPAYEATTAGTRSADGDGEGEEWREGYDAWKAERTDKEREEARKQKLQKMFEDKALYLDGLAEEPTVETPNNRTEDTIMGPITIKYEYILNGFADEEREEANTCNAQHRADTARQRRIDSARLLSAGKT